MVWLPVFGILNVHTDVEACSCTQWLYKHRKTVRESALEVEVDTGRKIAFRTGDLNPHVSIAPGFLVRCSTN